MGLTSVLQIGQSGIAVAQAGIQVAGNNMANATTPGFTRQTLSMTAVRGQQIGANAFVGNGVTTDAIIRHIDEAVLARLRSALSDQSGAQMSQTLLQQIETLQNELTDSDLSSGLTEFFATWNELASRPNDSSVRTLVVQRGVILAEQLQSLRADYTELQSRVDHDLGTAVSAADTLLGQIATLNREISTSEQGRGTNSALRDQRDNLIDELSTLIDINTHEQSTGAVDIFVGSIPLVLGGESRGIRLDIEGTATGTTVAVRVGADGSNLRLESGRVGALLKARTGAVVDAMDDIDKLAGALIWNVNRIHSQGQGEIGFTDVTGTYRVADSTAALNSSAADLPFDIQNGSFLLHLTATNGGERTTYKINVDLDGVGSDMSLDDLANEINSVLGGTGATASVTADGRLQLVADQGQEISFSEDSSGALAGLGVNTYFTGKDATDIGVNQRLVESNHLLAVGADHVDGSNGTALALALVGDSALTEFNGSSLTEFWASNVEELAVRTNAANTKSEATLLIRESLDAQRAGVSGVSLDEESINLINFQQQYQASARLISIANELMQVLMNLV